MELRPYQREAIAAVIAARRAGMRRMVSRCPPAPARR
jgi:superfamily II DNA or RNA helicase